VAVAVFVGLSLAEGAEKVFTYAISGQPESLDSAKATSQVSIYVTWLLCDALINISKDGQRLEPGLAESWVLSPDGLQVVVKLRASVSFHDGTPVDAHAVKANFERQFRPNHQLYTTSPKNAKEQMLQDLIEEIQVQDGLTLVFKLKYPGLHYLSQVDIISPAAAARLGGEFGRSPVCSGPFKFESWSPDGIVLAANEGYWAGRPRIDRVVFRFIPEAKGAVEALLKGDVDFTPLLQDPTSFDRVRQSERARLLEVPGLNVYYLGFYAERPPFNNLLLRRAVVQGINVPRALLFLGRGAAVAAKGPLPPAMKGHDRTAAQAPYDPNRARQLLKKGGFGSGLTVSLVHDSGVTFYSELAGAIQNDLRRIGITVEPLGKVSQQDVVRAVRAREGDMFLYSWHVRAPNPERLLNPLFHSRSTGTTNLIHYNNPMVDKLLDDALQLPEGRKQNRILSQIQKRIIEDAPMVFFYHLTRMAAHGDRVKGLELNLGSLPHDKLVTADLSP
jgi:ABC-type transport system substrate-binding protein